MRGHAQNEASSRSHALATLHLDSWAAAGSAEDADAAQGEQLLRLLERAREMLGNGPVATSDDGDGLGADARRDDGSSSGGALEDTGSAANGSSSAHDGTGTQSAGSNHVVTTDTVQASTAATVATANTGPPAVRRMRRYGRLVLVDLAGSERLKASGTSGGAAVAETGAINKSLFTLGQVLHALASRTPGSRARVRPSGHNLHALTLQRCRHVLGAAALV